MKSGALGRVFALLIATCCLVPLAALGAVIFLYWPIWPTSLFALLVIFLLARRLFALLSTPERDEPRSSENSPPKEELLDHAHRQH